jgi:hypothetical protein
MKLSYEELEKEWNEAVERNLKYATAIEEIHKRSFDKRYWDIRDITNELKDKLR